MTRIQVGTRGSTDDERMGGHVRQLRRSRGLTLVQLARLCGLSQPFLSQLERGQARPSMASLYRIARALGSSQLELIAGAAGRSQPPETNGHCLVRAGEGDRGPYGLGEAQLLVRGQRPFFPILFTCDNADPGDFHSHEEDEFLHVLSGACNIEIGESVFELSAGDSLFYVGGTPHRWFSPDGSSYVLFVVKQHVDVSDGLLDVDLSPDVAPREVQ
jgi:transcriptional regulator with XRE-family HTH domain